MTRSTNTRFDPMRSLKAHFLIAMPAMGDPNFNETVTYLCKHDEEGALGIVINRPTDMLLEEVFRQLSLEPVDNRLAELPVLAGGPLRRDRGFVLHRSTELYDSTLDAGAGIRMTVSPDILTALAGGKGPNPVLVALGYAGWDSGQLEAELAANAWLSVPADDSVLFETPFEQRWAAAAGLLGVDIHQLATYAGHA
ncbi:MAG TPA: YqgE/AlgH family protein [Gammaproteobacteria bacterium]|nr:YqgE/AlgH family protein [Gammaproteobacteria bacterium]